MAAAVVNINEVLDGHVALEVSCVDRLYLNAYVPGLQVGGQVVSFFTRHRGDPIPSPALMERNGNRFRRDVKAFATERGIPILRLNKPDRSRWGRPQARPRPALPGASRARRSVRVIAIVAAQEFQWVYSAKNRCALPGVASFDFVKEDRRVGVYYFYVWMRRSGPHCELGDPRPGRIHHVNGPDYFGAVLARPVRICSRSRNARSLPGSRRSALSSGARARSASSRPI